MDVEWSLHEVPNNKLEEVYLLIAIETAAHFTACSERTIDGDSKLKHVPFKFYTKKAEVIMQWTYLTEFHLFCSKRYIIWKASCGT